MTKPPHKPHNPHDRFFRSAMENRSVALAFMRYYLPEPVFQALDTDSLILQHDSYIDTELAESLSDLVYHCQLAGEDACISILIEHQSRPDVFMPVRIGHYLFSLLTKQLKQRQPHSTATESKKVPRRLLTPVYALVFYHGQTSPYPYSLQLADCFNDPLKLMANLFQHPIALIDLEQLVESSQQLPKPIGDTFMTIAEQLEARGIEKGKAQGITLGEARGLELGRTETQKTTALNMLKESLPVDLVVKVTGLSQREVEVLQQGLQH
jgi:predicted transposase YdaD